ncbi:hypothetical protein [Methanobrevibacter sp.]
MNKNKLLGIFILFVLLITCAGVSFAADSLDDSYIDEFDMDDEYIEEDLDEDSYWDEDLDDESLGDDSDWDEDLDDEDWDEDSDDWEDDWDDEDWDEDSDDWEDDWDEDFNYWDDEYLYDDPDFKTGNLTYNYGNFTRHIYYLAKSGFSFKSNSSDDDNESYENETEYYFAMTLPAIAYNCAGSAFDPCMMHDSTQKGYAPAAAKKIDFNDEIAAIADGNQNTCRTDDKVKINEGIEFGENFNILALLAFLIISVVLIL